MGFFNEIGKKISTSSQNVTQKTREFVNVTKLNGKISDEEKLLQQTYAKIGEQYVELYGAHPGAEFAEFVSIIQETKNRISLLEQEVMDAKKIQICPNCGAQCGESLKFCGACGTELPQSILIHCANCGNAIEPDCLFCPHCGSKINQEDAASAPETTTAPVQQTEIPVEEPLTETEEAEAVEASAAVAAEEVDVIAESIPEESEAEAVVAEIVPEEADDSIGVVAEEAPDTEVTICSYCGETLEPGAAFCSCCGQAVIR